MPDKENAAEIWCQQTTKNQLGTILTYYLEKTEKANEKLLLLLLYADSKQAAALNPPL